MSGRSPSGVASLRARFEQNANTSESPTPSRGRSPAGSVASDTSRPLSKVRTSFISVGESSGQMSHLAEEKDVGAPIVGDGAQLSREDEQSKANGSGPTSAPRDAGIELLKVRDDKTGAELGKKVDENKTTASDPAPSGLLKSTTGGSNAAVSSSQPSGTQDGDGSAAKEATNLGSILKGSAFEKEEAKKATVASQKPTQSAAAKTAGKTAAAPKPSATPAVSKPAEKSIEKPIEKEKITNGKPKESKAVEPKTQPKTETHQPAPSKTQTASKPEPVSAPAIKPAVKEAEKKTDSAKPQPPQPAPAASKAVAVDPPAPVPQVAAAPPKATAPSTEKTQPVVGPSAATPALVPAATATTLSKDKAVKPTAAPSTVTDPKASLTAKKDAPPAEKHQPEPSKETSKASASSTTAAKPLITTRSDQKSDGPSTTSKPATAKPAASAAAPTASKPPAKNTSSQKAPPTSGVGFTKPKPRSPTRPVKLPAHLVAQTAASAARHGDESHIEPHKDTATTTPGAAGAAGIGKSSSSKSSIPPATQQRKQPRMSMPATSSSKPLEKEKAKPRMSVAGGSSSVSGSFLERMMRPTQSSAQKTHEKLDPAKHSPPRKLSGSSSRNVSGAGPRTVTGASTHKPDEHAHNDGGHGQGREKHGGPTKSEIEHGEAGQEEEAKERKTAAGPESTLLPAEEA